MPLLIRLVRLHFEERMGGGGLRKSEVYLTALRHAVAGVRQNRPGGPVF